LIVKSKTALVTGSTSGIGLGIARALAARGANLVLNGFGDAAQIESLRAGLEREFGVQVAYEGADLMQPAQIESMTASVTARFGSIDILVNNAGIQHVSAVENFPVERWDAVIALNLSAAFHTIRCALPGMRARGWGRIINIASAHGLVASADKSAYVAAKHGIVGLTKTVAIETARTGITCNAICPGWVLTPLVQKQIDARAAHSGISPQQAKIDLVSEKQPSAEFVTTEQIGELAVFLCSPGADQVRGVAWAIDGGWTAQ
jgi:3-hydroxybutyrate dehydrogenase